VNHWKESQHCYSLDLETQRVWDYVGDGYVHRLIQSKTDGKLVELPAPCRDGSDDCSSCEAQNQREDMDAAIYSSKLDAIKDEYDRLLTTQLESQRKVSPLVFTDPIKISFSCMCMIAALKRANMF
jgi:BRCA1-associated protein